MADDEARSADTTADEPDHRPRLNGEAFDCPRCGAFAHQEWQPINRQVGRGGWGSIEDSAQWHQARCSRCQNPSVWRKDQQVFPLTQVGDLPSTDMPPSIRELYEEAATVAAVSPRAGAALARATVERLIKHLDTEAKPGDTLEKRIERLKLRVSSDLRTMLHVVRITGNDILHSAEPGALALMALDDTEGPQLLSLLLETANDLVDELITRQQTVQALHNKLPEWVQEKLVDGSAGTP